MRFRANRNDLAEAARWVSLAIAPKPSVPALAGITIQARDEDGAVECVVLSGYDFDTRHEARIAAEVEEPGTAVAAGYMVRDLVAALRGDAVDVSIGAGGLELRAGRSTYRVNTYAPGDVPGFPTSDATYRGTIDAADLERVLGIAAPSADDENPVARLKGVRLDARDETISVVGLRTTSLAIGRAPWKGEPFTVALPIRDLGDAVRGLAGEVHVWTGSSVLGLATADRDVRLRLFDTGDVDWRSVVPGFGTEAVEVEAELLRDAVRRAALTCKGGEAVTLAVDGDEITVTAGSQDVADGVEYVPATGTASASLSFGPDALLGALAATPAGPVTLTFGGPAGYPSKPLHITDKSGDFHHVVVARKDRR